MWYLVFLLWTGGEINIVRFPATSASACDTARSGIKFQPVAATSADLSGTSVEGDFASALAVFCIAGDQQTLTVLKPPVSPVVGP
jgi:hypothetical protein